MHNLEPHLNRTHGYRVSILCALLFLSVKLATWAGGYWLATSGDIRFDAANYLYNFHHSRIDPRYLDSKAAGFLNIWNYADSEWYLSIARDGYPSIEQIRRNLAEGSGYYLSTDRDSFRRYAFFPFFPTLVSLFTGVLPLEGSAFLSNFIINILAVLAFVQLYRVYFPEQKESVIWPFLLTFLFPFSVFYSLYYPEALFLALSMYVFIFMKRRKYLLMGLSGFLLSLTRPNGMLITIPVLLALLAARKETHPLKEKITSFLGALMMPAGFVLYLLFSHIRTGDWNFYSTALKAGWGSDFSMIGEHVMYKITLVLNFFSLPLHTFHASKVDTLVMLLFLIAISLMWFDRKFPRELTLWSTLLWITPFLVATDLMSFSRYMSVSFPVFLFMGLRAGWARYPAAAVFTIGYYYALRAVIRYDWLG
jgi:hypothetical protein